MYDQTRESIISTKFWIFIKFCVDEINDFETIFFWS